MKIHNYPGFFVDIEGLDGSGASTQVGLVAKELRQLGVRPYLTKEPTAGPIGKLVRSALEGQFNSLPPSSVQLLFAADRGRHLKQEIIPRLEKGQMVITDRYAWASVAFGSVYLEKQWLLELNRDFIFPDLSFFLEVEPATCLQRLAKEKTGVALYRTKEALEDAWETYGWISEKYWWAQIALIDGEQAEEQVTAQILARLKAHPKFKKLT